MNGRIHHPPRIAVVYESMFGNTRRIAEAICQGVSETVTADLTAAHRLDPWPLELDGVIVGAPTHVHGLSTPASRAEARASAKSSRPGVELAASAQVNGVREWLHDSPPDVEFFAAFDTRVDEPRIFAGSAADTIDDALSARGIRRLAKAESFLVDGENHLVEGELERALSWGRQLGGELAPLRGEHEV